MTESMWVLDESVCFKMQIQEDYFSNTLDKDEPSKFVKWETTAKPNELDITISFNDIFVETKETLILSYFFNFYSKFNMNMLVSGGTGTGKTRVVMTELVNTCNNPDNNKSFVPIAFSAQTSVFDLQNQLEG